MSDIMRIQSHKGLYEVEFDDHGLTRLNESVPADAHFIIDARVAELYGARLENVLKSPSVLTINATEETKSLECFPGYVGHLVGKGLRRSHTLIAIGGGVIQDITCFLAATMLRGVAWRFYPTTLLAQCDSCIGSKSSINCGATKNILGTFTPPSRVVVAAEFLDTLDEREIRSGVGEMLKVHAIAGPDAFARFADGYDALFRESKAMIAAIRSSLEIKRAYIEKDEFDQGPRLVFNLGHTFGHAIEAATDFAVPHGIAVTIGVDMANWMSWRLGIGREAHWRASHPVLSRNYRGYEGVQVPLGPFLSALAKDKKNAGIGSVVLILPDADGQVGRTTQLLDERFRALCTEYLERARAA